MEIEVTPRLQTRATRRRICGDRRRPDASIWRGRLYEGKLVVERRSTSRRKGHAPPVVGQAWGRTVEEVVQQLLPAAQYNPAIGAAILRLEPV